MYTHIISYVYIYIYMMSQKVLGENACKSGKYNTSSTTYFCLSIAMMTAYEKMKIVNYRFSKDRV